MHPSLQRWTPASMVVAAMFAVPAIGTPGLQETSGLAGVIGQWTDTTAGAPAIVVNGEQWNGQVTAANLEGWSRRLWGAPSADFVRNGSVPAAFPFAVFPGVSSFSSGTLRVQFNLLGGASDQIAGVLFGLGPSGDYHYVRYNTRDGNLAVWRVRNGEREVLHHGDVHKQLPLKAWHELVVRIDGREVSGHIAGDSTIAVRFTLDAPPVGRVGVWAKRDAITAFRRFAAVPGSR